MTSTLLPSKQATGAQINQCFAWFLAIQAISWHPVKFRLLSAERNPACFRADAICESGRYNSPMFWQGRVADRLFRRFFLHTVIFPASPVSYGGCMGTGLRGNACFGGGLIGCVFRVSGLMLK